MNEQLHYAFDPAGNLNYRTNNTLVENFKVNTVNELTANTNGGKLTVIGTTMTTAATNVTVNSSNALRYGDATFAATNMPVTTTYTAIAADSYGRHSTNTVTVSIATNSTYQYDGNGNLTNDGLRSFAYDNENQLIQVWVSNHWFSQFSYDGMMRRRIRQEFAWQSGAWVQTNEVYYVYDANVVIQERSANNIPTTTYTRGNDLSSSLQGAGGIGGLLSMTLNTELGPSSSNSMYYHSDANGNVTMLINPSQYIVAKYLYDAFGNVLFAAGSLAQQNLYRFSSKEAHPNSGLAYYLYRYYDPNLQRWPNRDPIGEQGGYNLYEFVGNLPTYGYDPQGLTVYVCNRKTTTGVGNHSYFYDSSAPPGGCQSCGTSGSSGGSSGSSGSSSSGSSSSCSSKGPCSSGGGPSSGDKCQPVPNSDGANGQNIMNCCKNNANNGIYVPCVHDCHSSVNNCLQQNGYNPPNNPRFGPPTVGPITPTPAPPDPEPLPPENPWGGFP
jgi:RHS repeat-associated protein